MEILFKMLVVLICIIGLVIACILIPCFIIIIGWLMRKHDRRMARKPKENDDDEIFI
mgnify:CR=1